MYRSNFEPGSTRWAVRRSQWRSMGIREEDMEKPKIAVINTSNKLSCCYVHLDGISALVQQAIRDAGGLAFEVRTVAPSDFVTSAGKKARYLMPTRDLMVNEVECMMEGAVLDGMICLSSCDKTTPAHLMAAARLDVPTLLLTCGYQIGGKCSNEKFEDQFFDIDDVYEQIGALATRTITLQDLTDMTDVAIQSPGVCAGLGTANSMHIVAEAIGMTLPGNSPIWAGGRRLNEYAQQAGRQIVELTRHGVSARKIITEEAIRNAVMMVLAVGGSVNTVRHIAAIATEAELPLDVIKLYEEYGKVIKLLTAVRPNGPFRTEDLEAAGGTPAVMNQLSEHLYLDALTVTRQTVGENIRDARVKDGKIIRTLADPVSHRPGVGILRGNLAPNGAIVKLSAVPGERAEFSGPANIYEGEDEAIAALGEGKINKGDVIVLRNMGPSGGPGTVFACSFVAALNGAGIAEHVAVVTDGELSGLNRGIIVGQLMPESAAGGPLAVVRQGETIHIDFVDRRIEMDVPQAEIQRRLKEWRPRDLELGGGSSTYLLQYAQLVQPIEQGAVLGKRKIHAHIP
ncbi:dihydroxy-acid dehydratase [Achromobacter denitrificans]|uniref:Dihydroxy-acid dehydratase n=2 Tax=Achromobacter denitrificans TaxID=32002 RepID=A0A6J5HDK3_ACHDE|nr:MULTISPECIES: dihydroxy-acid dehydratase [Achromobacter]ASC64665.1 dihydroxy-acid dehydratase [Achromobacter denitrificans]MBV2162120.1 dihydroxy-acid dehydratase [Achromobacter denitrificans]MDF3857731.1 dihydroxy-acid dehydratase [Achromobacter denitrificans]MDX3877782.1 dihydroxy-acid dehydratase [Achromobacter sp.]OLU10098.1 dihydroxy-acid dehydratase [Achromobacter denitrificans]